MLTKEDNNIVNRTERRQHEEETHSNRINYGVCNGDTYDRTGRFYTVL